MQVRVRLFAALRESAGRSEVLLQLEERATAGDAWGALVAQHPALEGRRANLATAVNRRYARFDTPLREDDELVFIPPVSGG